MSRFEKIPSPKMLTFLYPSLSLLFVALARWRDWCRDPNRYCVVFEVTKSRKGCEVSENAAIQSLIPGKRVCVSCESAAMRKHLGYRCHGHGIDDKSTRWTSVSSDNCHGRWIRRGQFDTCPCNLDGMPDFIFV